MYHDNNVTFEIPKKKIKNFNHWFKTSVYICVRVFNLVPKLKIPGSLDRFFQL